MHRKSFILNIFYNIKQVRFEYQGLKELGKNEERGNGIKRGEVRREPGWQKYLGTGWSRYTICALASFNSLKSYKFLNNIRLSPRESFKCFHTKFQK